jgi:DNA polymerase III delta prime subunit
MHAYLLTGGSKEDRAKYLSDLLTPKTELIHIINEKTSIAIKQIQDLNIPLSIAARIPRIVWIEESNLMTVPSQNALLKMLEEPPANTTFYLTCQSQMTMLPTIRSRAKTISLEVAEIKEDPKILADLKLVMAMTAGDRLINIVKRDRSESILWLSDIEREIRIKLKDKNVNEKGLTMLARIAKSAQNAHKELSSNCSVSLVTQNFYLLLPHTGSQT